MRVFNFKLKDFEEQFNAPEGFFDSDKAIMDNEIGNNLAPDWDYSKADIICTAILKGSEITVYLREEEDTNPFKDAIKEELDKKETYHAFNRSMEHGNFKGFMELDLNVNEIKPFKAKGWNKDAFFNQLMRDEVIPKISVTDVFFGDGSMCIAVWKKYLQTGNKQDLMDIVAHVINCVCKESVILKHKKHFEDNWNIDNNGFMLEHK